MSDIDEDKVVSFEEPEEEPEFEVITSTFKPQYDTPPEEPDATLPEEYRGKSKEELVAQLLEDKKRREEITKQADTAAAMTQSIEKLGQTLAQPRQEKASGPSLQEQQAAYEERRKRLEKRAKEEFLDDPLGVLQEFSVLQIEPAINQLLASHTPTYRQLATLDPETADIMKKHGAEVDDIVNSTPVQQRINNPNLYKDAAKRVKMEHLDELIQERVAEALAQQGVAQKQTQNVPSTRSPSFSEYSPAPRPPVKVRKPVLTAEDQRVMLETGMDEDDYLRNKYNYVEKRSTK